MIRELKKFSGIKFCFLSENFSDKRFRPSLEAFANTMTEIYLLFFKLVLPTFTDFDKYLQKEQSLIYLLFHVQQRFMRKLTSKYILPKSVENQSGIWYAKLDISLQNQKADTDINLCISTRNRLLSPPLDVVDIEQEMVDNIFLIQYLHTTYIYVLILR